MASTEYLLGLSLLGQARLTEASVVLSSALNRLKEYDVARWRVERIRSALGEAFYREGQVSEGSRMLRESHNWLATIERSTRSPLE